MQLQQLLVLLSFVLLLEIIFVDGRLFCFRRLKRKNKCGGLLRKNRYSNAEDCCAKRGQGFADRKIKLGRNRFRCTPCSDLSPRPPPGGPAPLFTAPVTPAMTQRAKVETTTPFIWSRPGGRYMSSGHAYSASRGDNRPVVEWEEWSPCSVSCGAGWRSRAKVCDDCDRNDYENVQSQPCMVNFYCPVDGNWGPWYPWEACSTSCSTGTRTRHRKCNYPPPAYGGAHCPGDAVALQKCTKKPCPVNGAWSEWSEFSSCSTTCGPGSYRKTRSCDSPLPQFGGKDCQGPESQVKRCEMVKCPVHGGWSLWSSYTLCSTTCGRGVRERSRSCDSPRPQYGGDKCDGPANQKQQCYGGKPCPVDGGWSSWTNFGYCRAPRCGRGYQIRSRSCSKPRPAHGGKPCPGQQYERIACHNDHDCPKNGSWCGWSQWNQCSSSCREDAPLQARQRICACPAPRNGGAECQGDSFQVQDCEGVPVCNPEEMSEEVEGASGGGDTDDEETEAETSSNSSSTKNSSSGETETTSKSMEDTRQAAEQVTQEYSAVTSEYSETERDEVDNTTTTVVNP